MGWDAYHSFLFVKMSCSVGHSEMLLSVQMSTEHIVAMLIQERDKLNRAIEALTGSVRGAGVRE